MTQTPTAADPPQQAFRQRFSGHGSSLTAAAWSRLQRPRFVPGRLSLLSVLLLLVWLDWSIGLGRYHPILPSLAPLQVAIPSRVYSKPLLRFVRPLCPVFVFLPLPSWQRHRSTQRQSPRHGHGGHHDGLRAAGWSIPHRCVVFVRGTCLRYMVTASQNAKFHQMSKSKSV